MINKAPEYGKRTEQQLREQLLARARAWLPGWEPGEEGADFGKALFAIAARLEAEVTQRLNRVAEKNFRGLLHWLGVRGRSAHAARMPVVFVMTPKAPPALARKPVRLQAKDVDPPVTFETQQDVQVVASTPVALVAIDGADDAFFAAPSSVYAPAAPKPLPTSWKTKSLAQAGTSELQLDPSEGLVAGAAIRIEDQEYRVLKADKGIVSVARKLEKNIAAGKVVELLSSFEPFADGAWNQQQHVLYIGDADALNIKGKAQIRIAGLDSVLLDLEWGYSTQVGASVEWQPFESGSRKFDAESGELVLTKPAGAQIGKAKVGGIESRWLRGFSPRVPEPLTSNPIASIALRINCDPDSKQPGGKQPDADDAAPLEMAAFANTAPLVLDNHFYPLGPEPRLFDAFYLSCPEAFSKMHARVTVHFAMADPTMQALVAAQVPASNNPTIFGVGRDGLLHRLQYDTVRNRVTFLKPVQPPLNNIVAAPAGPPVKLTSLPMHRGAVAVVGADVLVATIAKCDVWLWTERAQAGRSDWQRRGSPIRDKPVTQAAVLADGTAAAVYALCEEKLFSSQWDETTSTWAQIQGPPGAIALLAPVIDTSAPLAGGSVANGLIVVQKDGDLYWYRRDAAQKWTQIATPKIADPAVVPLAVAGASVPTVVGKQKNSNGLFAARDISTPVTVDNVNLYFTPVHVDDTIPAVQWAGFEFSLTAAGELTAIFIAEPAAGSAEARHVSWWIPFAASGSDIVYVASDTAGKGVLNGLPARVRSADGKFSLAVPGNSSDVLLAPFDVDQASAVQASTAAIIVVDGAGAVQVNDVVSLNAGGAQVRTVDEVVALSAGHFLLRLGSSLQHALDDEDVEFFHPGPERGATRESERKLKFADVADIPPKDTSVEVVTAQGKASLYCVVNINPRDVTATVNKALPKEPGPLTVRPLTKVLDAKAQLRAGVDVSHLQPPTVQSMREGRMYFSGAKPQVQRSVVLPPGVSGFLLLEQPWTKFPALGVMSIVLAPAQTGWSVYQPQTDANPELSYEYWDGTGWWKIDGLVDSTAYLLRTGDLSFCLPGNIAETEVAGRKARWIRARLVGGSYGEPEVSVELVKDLQNPNKTTQIIHRDTDAVRAPLAASVTVRYSVCCPITPAHIQTLDNGTYRDQSVANKTDAAQIDVFVPLKDAAHESGRALYIGFDAPLSGEPINLLFLVEKATLDDAFPLTVEALRTGGFEVVLSRDGTRGMNETGILQLTLADPPIKAGLFGKEGHWLRIKPRTDGAAWKPAIKAVFLNAAMAYAAETQELELLGSSDGSPGLRVKLARAPVVEGSLELRVREPLTDERSQELTDRDVDAVRENLRQLSGKWVKWQEVPDPADEPGGARVFSLDAETGVVQFGTGEHGMVPPIGRDAIMAVRYQRSGDARANDIEAWSSVNLVTPVAGVQAVVIPEPAAGGTNPEDVATVLRTAPAALQHRDRALTLRDIEQLALASSSDVVQAIATRAADGAIRVFIVGRAPDVIPTKATLRAARAFLHERASPDLATRDRLDVFAPQRVPVRVELELLISDIDKAGEVARAAAKAITKMFDTREGGVDGTGWPLGARPADADVAAVLTDLDGLEGIAKIVYRIDTDDAAGAALPARLRRDQLVTVEPDDIKVTFQLASAEVTA